MRKLVYAFSVSLDSFIEDIHGSLGWSGPDPDLHRHFNEVERSVDLMLYGRRLYELMAGFWPTAEEIPSAPDYIIEYARIWLAKPRLVFSNTLKEVAWNSQLFKGDIATEVNKLKAQPGGTLTVGGAGLAATFMQLDLIDEYSVYIYPILLGGGKRMFGPLDQPVPLRLVETRPFNEGVMLMRYARER